MTRLDARWLNFWARGQTWYHFWQDAAAVVQGQIIPVGQATETDLAQTVAWAPKNRLVGNSTEADLAQAVLRAKLRTIGQAAETELGQAVARVKRRAIGQAAETDLTQALFKRKIKIVGEPSEADAAQAVGRRKSMPIGQSFETDLAQTITEVGATVVPIGQAAEVDVALSIVRATGGEEPPSPPPSPSRQQTVQIYEDPGSYARLMEENKRRALELWVELFRGVLHLSEEDARVRAVAQLDFEQQQIEEEELVLLL